jgi:mRNA interferase RelE/StbE
MAFYNIEWKSSAAGELKKLDKVVFHRVLESVKSLSANPRPVGVRKLVGAESTYRIRCRDYRIVYTI